MRAGPLLGGMACGVLACWTWITGALVVGLTAAYGTSSNAVAVAAVVMAGLPVALGIVLLVRPRSRQVGAGFLMGLSIGMIIGAGVCASFFVPGAV